jgi:hypothetical protein
MLVVPGHSPPVPARTRACPSSSGWPPACKPTHAENEPTAALRSGLPDAPQEKKEDMTILRTLRRATCLVLTCLACGGPLRYQTPSTGAVPGADADIEADVNEQQRQTQLTVEITNLPPPDRVEPSSQHYVAWYRPGPDALWTRVAVLAYEPDTRQGRLQSSVPELRFVLQITAEPSVDGASPSPNVVFVQEIGG